jgi:hypothetical protein
MIDARYQGRGYARSAMMQLLIRMQDLPDCRSIKISYEPANSAAERLYESFGFQKTGEIVDGEAVSLLNLPPTAYPQVNVLLAILRAQLRSILGERLVGLYLHGSLVMGDFDEEVSDLDLEAALTSELSDAELAALQTMHEEFAARYPAWDNRVEVCYISRAALQKVRSRANPIANISPGEPLHRTVAKREWISQWYLVREHSVPLLGPPARTLIEPITKEEFLEGVRANVRAWPGWMVGMEHRRAQAYAILTLCRALYAITNGEQASKKQAALWAQRELPEWSDLIGDALVWRKTRDDTQVDHLATLEESRRFVYYVIERITGNRSST